LRLAARVSSSDQPRWALCPGWRLRKGGGAWIGAGCGFGSFSNRYGTAAGSLLEAEIVTADGQTRIVNRAREPDLFWALKGGGRGTFGVVTRVTLATHELPTTFGSVSLDLQAFSDEAYGRLLARFVDLYATNLCNPHWGEQARARPDNRLQIFMLFQGLTQDEALAAWKPLIDFANTNADYQGHDTLNVHAHPARYNWAAAFYRRYAPSVSSSMAGLALHQKTSGGPGTLSRLAPSGTD
jgi:hypothetical protein